MQYARDYALNALNRASEALKQVQGAPASGPAHARPGQDGGETGAATTSPGQLGQPMSSMTSNLLSSLTNALSGQLLVGGSSDTLSQVSDSSIRGGTAGGGPGTVMSLVSSSSSSEPEGRESIRVQRFKQELAGSCINIHALKRLTFHGVPDRDNLRGTVWKVWIMILSRPGDCFILILHVQLLLAYLPQSPEEWSQALAKRRNQYQTFCDVRI